MANNPLHINVELTLHELNQVLDALKALRGQTDYQVRKNSVEEFRGYQKETLEGYAVEAAETALPKRQTYADLIFKLSGEVITEDPKHLQVIRDARVAYEIQEATRKAEEALEETV
jgi:hypothetical protein